MYLIKTPWWLRLIYPSFVWRINTKEKVLYLTFDDGPHETATVFVLDELKKYNAKATFFCIGNNVVKYPGIYERILNEGHSVGNHTFNHLNGWKTNNAVYIDDIEDAAKYIDSTLFRPPYGKISKFQASMINQQSLKANDQSKYKSFNQQHSTFSIIMWDVLSGDFDIKLQPKECLTNVLLNARKGSIVVFHDSTKAWERMSFALPEILKHFSKEGYVFKALSS